MKRIYLDNAATTPLNEKVLEEMMPFLKDCFGNPSSIYQEGLSAKTAINNSRFKIGRILHSHDDEVYFVGGGTESDNLAIQGVVQAYYLKNSQIEKVKKPHVITSLIEHPAITNTIKELERRGLIEATYISVDKNGLIDLKEFKEALLDTSILVSVMYANNEIGTIEPISEVVKIVRKFKGTHDVGYPYVHTDACQAMNYCDVNVERLGVDLMTFSGSKIYGPKGIGTLFVRRGVLIEPIIYGGGQEGNLRSGTENVSGIVGMAAALEITEEMKESEVKRLISLRDYFIKEILEKISNAVLNGDIINRLPNNVHIKIPNIDSDVLVIELDSRGISCSAKSACKSDKSSGSSVLEALEKGSFLSKNKGLCISQKSAPVGTLRFSLGRQTSREDIDQTVSALLGVVKKYSQSELFED